MSTLRLPLPRADLLALLLLTLAVLIFFAPVWAGGGWLPYGGGDLVSFLWPTYTYAARALPGELPLWNPHLYGGAPFWADNQSGLLYPPNLFLFLLLDDLPYALLEGLVMAHFWLAGVSMYACLRLIRPETPTAPGPALAGAAAFMLSDVFVTHQGNLNLIAVAAWLPLVFLGAWRALGAGPDTRSAGRWVVVAGVAAGVGALAGHAQMTYFTGLLVGAAGVWHLARAWRQRQPSPAAFWHVLGRLALIGLIAFGLSAAALLPTLEMTGYTARAALRYEQAAQYSLPPRALVGLVAPWVYGRGPANFSGDWDRVEVGYMGALALALAVWGAVRGLRRRDGLAIFLLGVAGVAFLLALGAYFPLHRLAYAVLPGFQSIRVPARFVLLFNFAGAGLAALALEGLTARRRLAAWGIAGLVAAELVIMGAGVEVQAADPRQGYAHPEAVAWLHSQPDAPFRMESATPRWQPDGAALHGGALFDLYGVSNPLTLAAYDAYYWGVGQRGSELYNFLGAKYVIATGDEPPGDATFVPVYEAPSGVTIYLNTGADPLARLVYRAEPVDSTEAAWDAIHEPAWRADEVVYVEGGPALAGEPPPGASLFFTVYDPNTIAVVVNTPEPAYLLLAEVWYPGWQATIDGQPAPIYRANTAFRAVYLDTPGEHTVLLAFRPPVVIAGLALTGLTVLGLVVMGLRRRSII